MPAKPQSKEIVKTPAQQVAEISDARRKEIMTNFILGGGDLRTLTQVEQAVVYLDACEQYGISPAIHPFDMLKNKQNGKLELYANKHCAHALAEMHKVSIEDTEIQQDGDDFTVLHHLVDKDGRKGPGFAAVSLKGTTGDIRANLKMKCDTKAFRRGTLRLYGIGYTDDSELDTMKGFTTQKARVPRNVTPKRK